MAHQLVGEVLPAPLLQVHRHEGDVRRYVRVAKALVELDTVEDADAIVLEADGVCAQVAVAVADAALAHAQVEEAGVELERLLDERPYLIELASVDSAADNGLGLLEVLPPVERHRLQPAQAIDLGAPLRRGVEAGDAPGQAGHLLQGDAVTF